MTLWVCLFFNVVFGKTSQILNVEYMCFHINASVPLLPEVGWLEPLLRFFFFLSLKVGKKEKVVGVFSLFVCLFFKLKINLVMETVLVVLTPTEQLPAQLHCAPETVSQIEIRVWALVGACQWGNCLASSTAAGRSVLHIMAFILLYQ